MTDTLFLVFRTLLITIMTVGMMACLSEFRFQRRKLLWIMAAYSLWVIVSSLALLCLGGELLLLRLFFVTLSVPATVLTYWAANDTPAQAVFKSLLGQYRIQMERQSATLLTMQISALKEKLEKVKEVEEGIRIQRQDLRHQLQTVTELLAQGDGEAALDFLDAAQKRLDERKVIR